MSSSIERLSPNQLELLLAVPEVLVFALPAAKPATTASVRPPQERAPRLLEHLPVAEEVLEPAAVQAAPAELLTARLQDRSLPSPGLLAHVLVSKYSHHLPLYRLEKIYARRHGVPPQARRWPAGSSWPPTNPSQFISSSSPG